MGEKRGMDMYEAVTVAESEGNPLAESEVGARGLMQITLPALTDYNVYNKKSLRMDEMFSPAVNQEVGVWYLGKRIPQMLDAFGLPNDLEHRLWAYNAGIGMVRKGIMPKETREYIKKVKGLMGVE